MPKKKPPAKIRRVANKGHTMVRIEKLLASWGRPALLHDSKSSRVRKAWNKTPLMSCQGGLPWGKRGEKLRSFRGQSGFPVLVLHRPDLPTIPAFMKKSAYVVLTIDENNGGYPDRSVAKKTLSVACHASTKDLVPLDDYNEYRSAIDTLYKYLPLKFSQIIDYPCLLTVKHRLTAMKLYDESLWDELVALEEKYPCHQGLKIGGYPFLLNEVSFLMNLDPDMAIQLDSTLLSGSGLGFVSKNLRSIHYDFT